jgi:thiamine-monophosphate kinase
VLVEGRHFRRDWSSAIDIGRRAAAASLADIASMGGTTTGLVVGFGAPADTPAAWAVECTAGIVEEASSVGASLVGGDVVESPVITISVTGLGEALGQAPVLRSGARVGDVIAVSGRLGWAAAGLALLSRGFRSPRALVDAHRFPVPPYASGPWAAAAGATSMIDVSDGLIADAAHIARASDVVMSIDTTGWEVPEELQSAASAFHVDPREWMLTGGEDHALLATFPAGVTLGGGFRTIGTVLEKAEGDDTHRSGVVVDGVERSGDEGYRHFSQG